MMAKQYIIVLIGILFFISVNCQNSTLDATKNHLLNTYPIESYFEDLNEMLIALTTQHPKPFEFITENEIYSLVKKEKSKITDSTTIGEFYWICRRIVAAIGCGHTRISNPAIKFPDELKLPIEVRFIDSRLYVINPLTNSDKLKKGDEILYINGNSVLELRENIYEHLSADGYNASYKQVVLNKYISTYCSFQLNFPNTYEVTLRNRNSIKLKQSNSIPSRQLPKTRCLEKSCFEMLDDDTGLMTISGFGYYGADFKIFKSFINDSFNKLNEDKTENLIIDLRGNNGGDAICTSYLLQHLLNEEFIYFTENATGYDSLKVPIKPMINRFAGNVYLLIDGECFSSTTHFLALLKAHNFGIMIGMEAGGTYICNDNSVVNRLSNTGLSLRVARDIYEVEIKGKKVSNGILPDYIVSLTLSDLLTGNDRVLNFTKTLIKK